MAWLRESPQWLAACGSGSRKNKEGGTEISKQWSMYEDHWWPLINDTKDDLVLC